ncbi:MAG: threonylcarbamoyl-AMP synthase [Streptococcaceae bacterium]|jgi:L-threonylcarbamoyladenylate synthase|nr:threonylcarbamoyl-AMP synthase [Streptococcaceae bacterium]
MTEILLANDVGILRAAKLLKAGELVSFPTETVYGLGALALNKQAVSEVFRAKGRPNDNPLILHVSNIAMVERFTKQVPEVFYRLAAAFWPGSLTMILRAKDLPKEVTAGLETAAFRTPDNEVTLRLIEALGEPIVGPSANTSGKPSPTEAAHVYHDLKDKIAAILDGGRSVVGVESTVLDLTNTPPLILRPGQVSLKELQVFLPDLAYDKHLIAENETPKAPGMKYRHYAPDVPVYMVEKSDFSTISDQKEIAIVADSALLQRFKKAQVFELTQNDDVKLATRNLYRALRSFDRPELKAIYVQTFSGVGSAAYMNRLKKASVRLS